MFGKIIELSEFQVNGFRCKELILLHFHLEMLNYKMLKPNNEACLKCKYQVKKITINRGEMGKSIQEWTK